MCLSITLFPVPEGPSTTVVWPRRNDRSMELRTGSLPKDFDNPLNRTIMSVSAAATDPTLVLWLWSVTWMGLIVKENTNGIDHGVLLLLRHFRKNRQADYLVSRTLSMGKVADHVSELA